MSGRYYVYNYADISPETPLPPVVYSFNHNAAAYTGTIVGGTNEAPVLDSGASSTDDFYNGYYIVDTTIDEKRTVVDYDGATRTATLDAPFVGDFEIGDAFSTVDPTNWFYVHMQPGSSSENNFYTSHLVVDTQTKTSAGIYAYDGNTHTASLSTFWPSDNSI
jgi:hypothetical protein